ncbi:MAG: DUF427 domain-containing protein [Chloroflexia bacterium]|nr:DUF427 domain-containing protein [Chloroflexia bacterium]
MDAKAGETVRESVWDYPRPPRIEPTNRHITVEFNGVCIAESRSAFRVLETSHPPVFYLPPGDVRTDLLIPADGASYCEWKGLATYLSVRVGTREEPRAVWTYRDPTPRFRAIAGYFAFYPSQMDRCTVDGETVRAQAGDFYGGWITREIAGPFKGEPGTQGW